MVLNKACWCTCKYCNKNFRSSKKGNFCITCKPKISLLANLSSTTFRMIRNREFVRNYKLSKKCVICGYKNHTEILDFHHKNKGEKITGVNILMKTLKNVDIIEKEIKKCILLCPNCHREIHLMEKYGKK